MEISIDRMLQDGYTVVKRDVKATEHILDQKGSELWLSPDLEQTSL
jgi:hypothetical protein